MLILESMSRKQYELVCLKSAVLLQTDTWLSVRLFLSPLKQSICLSQQKGTRSLSTDVTLGVALYLC